jgi:hypothetical protein
MQIAEPLPSVKLVKLELVANADGTSAVLYVYRDGTHWTTATGRLNTLREFAARYYPGAQLNERIVE